MPDGEVRGRVPEIEVGLSLKESSSGPVSFYGGILNVPRMVLWVCLRKRADR